MALNGLMLSIFFSKFGDHMQSIKDKCINYQLFKSHLMQVQTLGLTTSKVLSKFSKKCVKWILQRVVDSWIKTGRQVNFLILFSKIESESYKPL